jgi:hypothetical protein
MNIHQIFNQKQKFKFKDHILKEMSLIKVKKELMNLENKSLTYFKKK